MGEVINLRKARKSVLRAEAEVKAAENRALFGLTRAEREARRAEKDLQARRLEGHALAKRDEK
ncbi:MAG: hypothetical protein B7Y75_01910 [Azorhizobium sp. 35-67-5]|nr:MAG: hypothetical protein B7Y75_01910 [Azorhizobium sp. 35-67-5]